MFARQTSMLTLLALAAATLGLSAPTTAEASPSLSVERPLVSIDQNGTPAPQHDGPPEVGFFCSPNWCYQGVSGNFRGRVDYASDRKYATAVTLVRNKISSKYCVYALIHWEKVGNFDSAYRTPRHCTGGVENGGVGRRNGRGNSSGFQGVHIYFCRIEHGQSLRDEVCVHIKRFRP